MARKLMELSLRKQAGSLTLPVDEAWYFSKYPDVAAAKISAVEHYNRFGITEGRLPNTPTRLLRDPAYQGSVQQLVIMLWAGYSHDAAPQLESLVKDDSLFHPLKVLALKSLADWYFCNGQVGIALRKLIQVQSILQRPDSSVVGGLYRCYIALGEKDKAQKVLKDYGANLKPSDASLLTGTLNGLLNQNQLQEIPPVETFQQLAHVSDLPPKGWEPTESGPLVSIIVPVFNAGEQVLVAINSLRAQTYTNIEIIIIDDASTDDTPQVLRQVSSLDPRVIVRRSEVNGGAYLSRNSGVRLAKGEFITVHDSDDWSHPQKIEKQVESLLSNPKSKFCYSYWVRVLPSLDTIGSWMLNNPLIQLNHSSAMFRKEVIETCGLWDEVKVAGDAEYMRRVRLVFGDGTPVLPQVPLSLSLVHSNSLTQTKATHVSTIYFGLRRLYREATQWSHKKFNIDTQFAQHRHIPSPLGNLPKPSVLFETVLIGDFSQSCSRLIDLVNSLDDPILLHIPGSSQRCADRICDEIWELCFERGISFVHPGCRVEVHQVILQSGDLILNRPFSLPHIDIVISSVDRPVKVLSPATQGYVSESMIRTLFACGGEVPSIAELFEPDFYLQQNPDVANAGIVPLTHFLRYGQKEGRPGFSHRALEYEERLWQQTAGSETSEQLIVELKEIAVNFQPRSKVSNNALVESAYASWALARWYASQGVWAEVLYFCALHFDNPGQLIAPGHRGPWLLWFNARLALAQQREVIDSNALLELQHEVQHAIAQQGLVPDLILAAASAASALKEPLTQREQIKSLWRDLDFTWLAQMSTRTYDSVLKFDDLPSLFAKSSQKVDGKTVGGKKPLVSVIIPCHNAATTLPIALQSLLAQSWPALQVIVVDDASTDQSVRVVSSFVSSFEQKGVQLKVVKQPFNQGAYAARNRGLEVASGEFITTHDADDWSHPQKIERQVKALLKDRKRVASVSHWVRANEALQFSYWRPQSSWVHPNMSSLMFRRSVFDRLGYWDRVSVSGDTEYYYRILATFGFSSVVEVMPGTPLAFGRHSEASLTQEGATHIRTQFAGLRFDYIEAARQWHEQASSLYMDAEPKKRPFVAPTVMLRPSAQQIADEVYDEVWYLNQYPDVKAAGVDGKKHFMRWGLAEGRIGGPRLPAHQQAEYAGLEWQLGTDGERAPVYMVFAHQVTSHQFGAERSLLDVIENWQVLGRNVVVVVPNDERQYTAKLLRIAQQVHVQPYTWWHAQRSLASEVVVSCQRLIEQYNPVAVYANTLTLWEPLLAAGECGVPRWVHVRELPNGDESLCLQLGGDSAAVREHVLGLVDKPGDGLIANSAGVADFLNMPGKAVVIPNQLDLASFSAIAKQDQAGEEREQVSPLRVGMLSSNIQKKGVVDVVEVAKKLATSRCTGVHFILYGPETTLVKDLMAEGLPANLSFAGYADDPVAALATLDVVLNLSHFQESFGRTVLEAMAAGRVVLCYDWGALSELVSEGAGIKVPFGDTQAVVDALIELDSSPALREQLSKGALHRAQEFSADAVRRLWLNWLSQAEQSAAGE